MNTIDFGKKLRKARITKGWTQMDLARALGYSNPQFVSLLERGQAPVPLYVLGKLVVLLDLPEIDIINDLIGQYRSNVLKELAKGKKLVSAR